MAEAAGSLAEIGAKHGIILLLQFGSTVTGKLHDRSDLDLAVLLARVPSFAEHGDLVHDLQVAFPGREVDLAILNRADPLFLKKVTGNCRLLFGSRRELQRFSIYAFKRYQDHRRYLELERRFVERFIGGAGR